MITKGTISLPNTSGAKAIDAIDAQLVVETCDIGYGDAASGIVLGECPGAKIVNSRFEWGNQSSSVYPISIVTNSFYHFFSGNSFTGGCTSQTSTTKTSTQPRMREAILQINDFQSNSVAGGAYPPFPDGFVDFNIDVYFRRPPTFPAGVFVQGNLNSAFAASKSNSSWIIDVNTNNKQLAILNGGGINLFPDEYLTSNMYLDGSNGRTYFGGDLISAASAPTLTNGAGSGTRPTNSITGTNTSGLLKIKPGTSPGGWNPRHDQLVGVQV